MIALLISGLAAAAEPIDTIGETPSQLVRPGARIPPEHLAALGLAAPTTGPTGALRYPLDRGALGKGLVSVYVVADPTEASIVFDGLSRTAATRWPPLEVPASMLPSEHVLGDGTTTLLVRFDNIVVFIKDPAGLAAGLASSVRESLRF